MNLKEKAIELVNKMYQHQWRKDTIEFRNAKQCALIAVDFARDFITGDLSESFDKTMYLFEIKQEIEKL
jgi:hypothetical protein